MGADTTDVVVVGAGLAGHVAALTAAEAGMRVLLLEKGDDYGGSSVIAGGGLIFVGTDLQKANGIDDSPEKLRDTLVTSGGGVAREELIGAYVDGQLETYEWLSAQGIAFSMDESATTEPFTRVHFTGTGVATHRLHQLVEEHAQVEYRAATPAVALGRDDDGRVTRVAVLVDGEVRWWSATRGVVLTSGGFSRGLELVRTFTPQWTDTVQMGGAHNTGDGITMGWSLGAGVADMPYVAATFGATCGDGTGEGREPMLLYPNYKGAVIVNRDAERFANEEMRYKEMGRLCIDQPGAVAFEVFDQPVLERSEELAAPLDLKAALRNGYFEQADTLDELADALGLDPVALTRTIERYNQDVRAGEDTAFGRPIAADGKPGAAPIETPPFYGYRTRPGLTSTFAGLTVDAAMRVLDVYGAPIPGLHAAGEVVGGFHGSGYYSGTALGKAAVFGRIAGRAVVGD